MSYAETVETVQHATSLSETGSETGRGICNRFYRFYRFIYIYMIYI